MRPDVTLIVRTPNWLGDLVMSLPAISILARQYPGMSLWSHPRVSGLIPVFFPSTNVFTAGRLKGSEFSTLLLMTDSFRSAFAGLLSRIPQRIGYRTDMRGFLLTNALNPPSDRSHHHSADYDKLALAAGGSGTPSALKPAVEPEGEPHTAYFAGARYGSAKMWPHFRELANRIFKSRGLPSVFYGSPEEKPGLTEISSGVPLAEVRTDLTLSGLASGLLAAELAVGNDSGGVHLSAVLGIPTVTIFGSTSPLWTAPTGRFTAAVTTDRECSPCFKRECPEGVPGCLSDISTDEVLTACMGLMKMVSDE
ncbi:MAG: glycosyltransferase family 9 protein [Candidatus Aegiribacteria sp.]|nr:glycosyltransferase family 9 protein [Candidatus Aegiribacteria sp.]